LSQYFKIDSLDDVESFHCCGVLIPNTSREREGHAFETDRAGQSIDSQLVRFSEKRDPCSVLSRQIQDGATVDDDRPLFRPPDPDRPFRGLFAAALVAEPAVSAFPAVALRFRPGRSFFCPFEESEEPTSDLQAFFGRAFR